MLYDAVELLVKAEVSHTYTALIASSLAYLK